jgi:hypothetical protein
MFYISGFVVRSILPKITCESCIDAIYDIEKIQSRDNIAKFTVFKDKGGLVFPSKSVFDVVKKTEIVLEHITNEYADLKNLHVDEICHSIKMFFSIDNHGSFADIIICKQQIYNYFLNPFKLEKKGNKKLVL